MEVELNLEFLVSSLKPVMRRAGEAIIEVYKSSKKEIETKEAVVTRRAIPITL